MAVLSVFDGPVIWMLLCLICPAVTVMLVFMSIRRSSAQSSEPHLAVTQASYGHALADHQVSRNGTVLGTHTEADLRHLLASGKYRPADFYWRPGMPSWAPLSNLLAQASGVSTPGLPPSHQGQRIAVKGRVISFSIQNGSGMISGLNGVRYNFVTSNWGSPTMAPSVGQLVEFEANGPDAVQIFPAQGSSGGSGSGEFYRSSDNVIFSGVCAGLAHKWNSDPVLIRIAMVFIPLGWIFYLIGSMSWSARPTR
jgi:phage shock protein PspC (stress-responsive transcriptional regulator)